ncbi:MAG: roadblock/LC7 domain-containing protein [Thermoleophilia bacterium]
MNKLEATILPYLEIGGVDNAALVSSDGLLVASVGDGSLEMEAIAAYVATTISAAGELSSQLESAERRIVSLDLPDHGMIIAPVTDDILLVLVGQSHLIRHLGGSPAA